MRVRTEARKLAILDMAARVFLEMGYERTSMSEITARLGGSKGTLYSYFESKEELFMSVVLHVMGKQVDQALQDLVPFADGEPRGLLVQFGEHLLAATTSPEALALKRLIVAHMQNSDVEQKFRKLGPGKMVEALENYLAAATAAGRLRVSNPAVAARHLIGLYEAESNWVTRIGPDPAFSRERIRQEVERAVDVFLAAYGARAASA